MVAFSGIATATLNEDATPDAQTHKADGNYGMIDSVFLWI